MGRAARPGKVRVAVHARPLRMRRAPDFDLPVGRLVVGAEHGGELDRHCGADRRSQKLILARPLRPDGPARHFRCDEGRVERAIVGGVVAVGAGAVAMEHGDLLGLHAERLGEPVAQDRRPLGVRPHLERAVLELGERAGWADRAIGEERPRIARRDGAALHAAFLALLDGAVARRLCLEPLGRANPVRAPACHPPTWRVRVRPRQRASPQAHRLR